MKDFFDPAMGITTGAGAIFGATGGVMEAALRTAADTLTGQSLDQIEYQEVRGTAGIKEAVYQVAGMAVKVAVASGMKNANELMEKVRKGEADYHFIEIMGCPGGCVNGGGQPTQSASVRSFTDLKAIRAKALYDEDANLPLRKAMTALLSSRFTRSSLENQAVKRLIIFFTLLMWLVRNFSKIFL